ARTPALRATTHDRVHAEFPMNAPDATRSDPGTRDAQTARLLEQLLQIARTSALEEMASGMAHELNQPIGAIATFAQAAQRMLERPEPMLADVAEVLRHISAEAMSAGQGIHRIRRLFNGQEPSREVCSLASILEELRPILDLLAARNGVTLTIDLQPDLPLVAVDRLRIQHVLFTLVQNALESAHGGRGATLVRVDVSGDRYGVLTSVIDSGAGVAGEARD